MTNSNKKIIYPLLTAIQGTLPLVVFFVFSLFSTYRGSLIASVVTFAAYFLVDTVFFRYDLSKTILLSALAFIIMVGMSFVPAFAPLFVRENPALLLEILALAVFSLSYLVKDFFRGRILMQDREDKDFQLIKFDATSYVIKIVRYILVLHLVIVLFYKLYPAPYHTPTLDLVVYSIILYVLIIFHFSYEIYRYSKLHKEIVAEEWLPIVNEHGTVQGKVAWSVSKSLGNKYLHPVIRIALVHKGMLYLKPRPSFFITQQGKMDYPFERYLEFNETMEEGVRLTFEESGISSENLKSRFIFKYTDKNIESNRLIYLYACVVADEEALREMNLEGGKFWTGKQIEENRNSGLFSEYFEKEYDLLDNTVLLADKLMNDLIDSDDNK